MTITVLISVTGHVVVAGIYNYLLLPPKKKKKNLNH